MDYKNLIETNFGVKINDFTLLDSHFGTDIFLAETEIEKYIVKKLPIYMSNVKNEGKVTDYLRKSGIKVPYFLRLKNGACNLVVSDFQITVQEFIEGCPLPLNEATDSFLKAQIELLGKINNALVDFSFSKILFNPASFAFMPITITARPYRRKLTQFN